MPLEPKSLLVLLRKQFSNLNGFSLTKHAEQRLDERDISYADIINCVFSGSIIEIQDHHRDPKVLIKGCKQDGTQFYIVMALTEEEPFIITVCRLDENVWEAMEDKTIRK